MSRYDCHRCGRGALVLDCRLLEEAVTHRRTCERCAWELADPAATRSALARFLEGAVSARLASMKPMSAEDVRAELSKTVDELAAKLGISRAEVLRRAMQLVKTQ